MTWQGDKEAGRWGGPRPGTQTRLAPGSEHRLWARPFTHSLAHSFSVYGKGVKRKGAEARRRGFKSCLCSWASDLVSVPQFPCL